MKTGDIIIELNNRFSKKEKTLEYIKTLMLKKNIEFEIEDKEVIYGLTNGNGHLILQFMETEGETFKKKIQLFKETMDNDWRNEKKNSKIFQ